MASEEDDALLFLIFQHLKVNGYKKAAKVLEKHVAQIETPEEGSSLHDIYTGWMKLCSLAQDAKQETEDSTSLKKKSIKPEPATSEEEEGADAKLSNNVEAKPPPESDGVEPPSEEKEAEAASETKLIPAGETKTASSDSEEEEKEQEETKTEQESAPVEESAEEVEAGAVEASQAAPDQAEDQIVASDPAVTTTLDTEEHKEDEDELKQETEAATEEISAPEQTAVNQTEEESSAAKV